MNNALVERPTIYDYENSSKFLEDMLFWLTNEKKLSQHKISKRAGFGSPNYIKMIRDGRRNLGLKSAPKLAAALELERQESEYFCMLLRYERSRSEIEKRTYLQSLNRFKQFFVTQEIEADHFELFAKWYITTILEFIGCGDFPWSVKDLATALEIESTEVEEALELLERLELIEKSEAQDTWVRTNTKLETPKRMQDAIVAQYLESMLSQAQAHLGDTDIDRRSYQALTVPLTKEHFEQLREQIWQFMKRVNEETSTIKEPIGVYQLNIQLFSLLDMRKFKRQG